MKLAIKYKIYSFSTVRKWILKHNKSHDELKPYKPRGNLIMATGRKTTYDERVEIVKYCIEHQNNYAETAEKYNVSYQQVYSWCKNMRLMVLMHFRINVDEKKLEKRCLK